ncbi:hypothetical protein EZI45_03605 [Delftia tsuruhatensis]|nr:hypothetical protein [Delftia sp.]TDF32872.1 hypothetical protein EZI45_03605 [Delftia tsuruhatensis]
MGTIGRDVGRSSEEDSIVPSPGGPARQHPGRRPVGAGPLPRQGPGRPPACLTRRRPRPCPAPATCG